MTTKNDEEIREITLDWLKTSDNKDTAALRFHALEVIKELQDVVALCIDQGVSLHVDDGTCPEDDTCNCPNVKRVNAAMKGFREL